MQAAHSNRPRTMAMIVALVLALGAVLAFALLSGSTRTAQAATGHHKHHARHHSRAAADQPGATDPDTVQSGDQTTPDTGAATSSESTTGPDPGNVQSGDQTTPDTGAAPGENPGSGESSVEPEAGQPGEPAIGNTDPAGAPGPDCTGNCQN